MNAQAETLICPKCKGNLRTYERNGIHIDQCEECRGIFLDRGELEQLISAESSYLGDERAGRGEPAEYLPGGGHHGGGHGKHGGGGYGKRGGKRRGLLGELFD